MQGVSAPLRGLYFDFNIKANQHQFSPPYGDHIVYTLSVFFLPGSRPLTGIILTIDYVPVDSGKFSPPYGDHITYIVVQDRNDYVFAPLRGLHQTKRRIKM